MKKKKYEMPSIKVMEMEAEPVMASFSSVKPGDDPKIPIEDGDPGDDGTDLEKTYGVKSHSVWD